MGDEQDKIGITRGALIGAAATGAAAVGLGFGIAKYGGSPGAKLATSMTAVRYPGTLPLEAPDSRAWDDAEAIRVALQPQQLAPPMLAEGSIDDLTVAAMHDGVHLAFRLSWHDPDRDDLSGLAQFGDQVAVQLPAGGGEPPITMGAPGQPVHIIQWRAAWQRDVDGGRTGVDDIYPGVVRDVSPEQILPPAAARLYTPGRAVGNPMSSARRERSCEEVVAEGFGSVTTLKRQRILGRGVWADGSWSVAIGIPMDRTPEAATLAAGSLVPVAFALWLGSKGNRGSRKHYTEWVPCRLA